MRISTNTIFQRGVGRMGEIQTDLARTQQQVSTGKRILSPSDDPVASARALEVTNSQEINAKYAINRRNAKDSLSAAEGALQSVTSLLQDVKTLIVSAGNGTLDNQQRGYIATELQGRYEELLGLANSRDGVGNYLFAGYKSSAQPFSATAAGANYSGDQGSLYAQVHTARQIEVTANGFELFERIPSKDTIVSSASSANNGLGKISTGVVTDRELLTGARYDIILTDNGAGGFNYAVYNLDNPSTDTTDPTTAIAQGPYDGNGQSVGFDGMQFEISGAVQDQDSFEVRSTSNQSIFTTLKNLIGALQVPATTTAEKTRLSSNLTIANGNIDSALDHVLTTRAGIGASLKEIDSLDELGEDINLQYAQSLSELQDLDYVQAITDLTKQQTALQAAQQSFIKLTSMSLFNYMS